MLSTARRAGLDPSGLLVSSVILTSCFEATPRICWDDLRYWNRGQMTRATTEPALYSQNSTPHQRLNFKVSVALVYIHGKSLVESNFKSGILLSSSRGFTTMPLRAGVSIGSWVY
ncbi:hypothetical protein AVEN_208242-1 [Araneus ventricosus]|uniref:Uncharacterized protein n=1 Tax=Araneus ventricosus TaxID=182803 RepID=A0A4Y2H5L2_ARAVE|nr:hypothetical protein AVEN_260907-1 [Araneus ventricosus]GBM58516.1 hypothetical protein AVEN_40065-1 [Araneus ventricosus]GBM59614.1 hypothetical protein AVEN_208242-1 [Araneus ventricosus]